MKQKLYSLAEGENAKALLAGLIDGDGTVYVRDKEMQLSCGRNKMNIKLWLNFVKRFNVTPFLTSDGKNTKIRLVNASNLLNMCLPYIKHPEKKEKILSL